MLDKEPGDDYFAEVQGHLKELRFRRGVLLSARLGAGNKGTHYVLRRPREQSWRDRLTGSRDGFSFQIADRDENGARALAGLRARGIGLVASTLGQSSDHVLSFFRALRAELGFYAACLNLHQALTAKGEPVCFPHLVPSPAGSGQPVVRDIREVLDVAVARIVGHDSLSNLVQDFNFSQPPRAPVLLPTNPRTDSPSIPHISPAGRPAWGAPRCPRFLTPTLLAERPLRV
jgi:hypothetical protein